MLTQIGSWLSNFRASSIVPRSISVFLDLAIIALLVQINIKMPRRKTCDECGEPSYQRCMFCEWTACIECAEGSLKSSATGAFHKESYICEKALKKRYEETKSERARRRLKVFERHKKIEEQKYAHLPTF